jgi:hypothetical protein
MTEQRNFISISTKYSDASLAAGNAVCRLVDYCEKTFDLDYVSATWLVAWLVHSLPKTIESVPQTKQSVEKQATRITIL